MLLAVYVLLVVMAAAHMVVVCFAAVLGVYGDGSKGVAPHVFVGGSLWVALFTWAGFSLANEGYLLLAVLVQLCAMPLALGVIGVVAWGFERAARRWGR